MTRTTRPARQIIPIAPAYRVHTCGWAKCKAKAAHTVIDPSTDRFNVLCSTHVHNASAVKLYA